MTSPNRVSLTVETEVSRSLRANQVCSMFDAPLEAKCARTYEIDFPWDAEPWSVGLVVGPSGSGKSTVARHVWGEREPLRWDGAGIVDDFPERLSTEQIANAVSSVGFSTPPAWLRPHRVLSMGEQFRAEVARRMMGTDDPIVIDEYTSVVDRQVAQVASYAIQRYVRGEKRHFVAVGCHYDVIDWLQPDWILDMATQTFTRRLLQRRPAVEITIGRLPRAAWGMFAPFHYMTADLPPATHGFGLWANGQLACSAWLAVFPHPKAKDIVRVARIVTLPDYQGLGLAFTLLRSLGAALKAGGRRLRNYPAHPSFIEGHKRKTDEWSMVSDASFGPESGNADNRQGDRFVAKFEYIGPANARFATQLGVTRSLSGKNSIEETKVAWQAAAADTMRTEEPIAAVVKDNVVEADTFPDLLAFIPLVSPNFTSPGHLWEWCDIIERCLLGGVRAVCSVPIRHHKTETTIHGIAWLLCMDPTIQVIYMVADERMANDRANRIRLVCEAAAARFGRRIGPEKGQNVKTSWKNEYGGGVQVMSAKQSRQGSDLDVLFYDDPIDESDVFMPEIRERVDMAIAIYTARAGRIGRRGSAAGVMSRWHPDDPNGRRLARSAHKWEAVIRAALAVNDNGEEVAFAPDVMSVEELKLRRSELAEIDPTERMWHANFQNNPLPDGLGLFRSPLRYSSLPAGDFRAILGADLSYSPSRRADYFALVAIKVYVETVIEDGKSMDAEVGYVVNAWRERWDPAQGEQILRMARGMYPGAQVYSYMSGPEVGIAHYLAEKGIPIQVIPARYSKRQRAQGTIDRWNAGRIKVPESAPWVAGFCARFMLFTGDDKSGNDDEIDAIVSGVDGGMTGRVGTPRTTGKRRI